MELTRRRAWAITLVATFTMTVSQLDRTTLSVLAPTVTKALGISEVGYGWLASAFSIAYLLGAPLAGWWLDRVGARRGLVISVLAWSLVAGMHSLTLGYVSLFALRIALGVTESPSYPGAALTIQRVLPAQERSRGFGLLFTGSSIGVMIAAPLAAWLFSIVGWRVAFLGSAAIGLVWVPIWLALTGRARGALDQPRAAPVSYSLQDIVGDRKLVRSIIAVLAAAPLQLLPIAWGAKYLARTFAVAQQDVGHYLWLPLLGSDVAALVFGDLDARRRSREEPPRLLFAVAASFAASIALLGYATTPAQGIGVLSIALAGGSGMYTLLVSDLLTHTEPSKVARTSSYLPAAQSLAHIVVSPLIGLSVAASASYAPSAMALGLWVIPGALVWLLWRT